MNLDEMIVNIMEGMEKHLNGNYEDGVTFPDEIKGSFMRQQANAERQGYTKHQRMLRRGLRPAKHQICT